jgi:hypothetical protein
LAIKPRDNETFYREVDEELRRDRARTMWQRYGRLAIVALVLFFAALGGWFYWQNQKLETAGKHGEELTAAFEDVRSGRTKEGTEKLDRLAKEGSEGYRAAALLTKADLAIAAGKESEALAALRSIADDKGLPQPYRDLALVRVTHLEYDRLPPAAVIQRLGSYAVAGNPWLGSAGEMVAIAHLKMNKPQAAAPIFGAIARDETVPASLRSRATQMASSLGVDAVKDPAAATKE